MTECVLDVTGTSPSLTWSSPGTRRGITSPTRTDAVDQCVLTTLRYSRHGFNHYCIQETQCSQRLTSKLKIPVMLYIPSLQKLTLLQIWTD